MRAYLKNKLSRLWVKLVTLGLNCNQPASCQFQPGDVDGLLQTLIDMNALLARAGRI